MPYVYFNNNYYCIFSFFFFFGCDPSRWILKNSAIGARWNQRRLKTVNYHKLEVNDKCMFSDDENNYIELRNQYFKCWWLSPESCAKRKKKIFEGPAEEYPFPLLSKELL